MSTNFKNRIKNRANQLANIVIRAGQIGVTAATGLLVAEKVTERTENMTAGTAAGAASAVAAYHVYDIVVNDLDNGIDAISNKLKAAKAKAAEKREVLQAQINAANDIAAAAATSEETDAEFCEEE